MAADDGLVSGVELGELIDLHERQVRKLAERGVIERLGRGRYDPAKAIVAYIRHLREEAAGRASDGSRAIGLDIVSERARLAKENADMRARRNAQEAGELVAVTLVTQAVVNLIAMSKAHLLKVAPRIAGRDAKLRARIQEAIEEALEELTLARVEESTGGKGSGTEDEEV